MRAEVCTNSASSIRETCICGKIYLYIIIPLILISVYDYDDNNNNQNSNIPNILCNNHQHSMSKGA